MKKIILVALAAIMVLSAVSCKANYNMDLSEYVKLSEYKGIQVSQGGIETYIKAQKEQLVSKATECKDSTEPIAKGDELTVKASAKLDGKDFTEVYQDIKTGELEFVAGDKYFNIGELDEKFIGKKVGDKIENYEYTFPSDHEDKELQGKKVTYTVEITTVKRDVVPEYNDKLVKDQLGIETTKEYEENCRKEYIQNTAMENVYNNCEIIKLPRKNVQQYYDNMIDQYENMARNYMGTTLDQYIASSGQSKEDFLRSILDECKQEVKKELILISVSRQENISFNKDEYKAKLEELANSSGATTQDYEKNVGRDTIERQIICDKAVQFIADNTVIVD